MTRTRTGDHIVILDGSVGNRRSKVLAEDIADSVWGVQDVHNDLSIRAAPQVPAGEVLDTLPANIFKGEPVVGSLGRHIGWVGRVYADDFVLVRPGAADLHVPFDVVQDNYGDRVRLRVRAEQIDRQGWMQPQTANRE